MTNPLSKTAILVLACALASAVAAQNGKPDEASKTKTSRTRAEELGLTKAPVFSEPKELRPQPEIKHRVQVPPPDDVAAAPDDAARTESGLATRIVEAGHGEEHPAANDLATLRYTGWTTDGVTFDTTSGQSRNLRVNGTIPGFEELLRLMVPGERRLAWIPSELAYDNAFGKPRGTLVFDVELVSFRRAPATPQDVAAIPEDAKVSDSGLAHRVLREGTGTDRPEGSDIVEAHFNVWNSAGVLLDSTEMREDPVFVALDEAIPAFKEAFPSMRPGERRRLWIPEELAKIGQLTRPDFKGVLVADVELLAIRRRPKTPQHVKAPPPTAETTMTGLAYEILQAGSGERHPRKGDTVEVRYAGWTTDGEMFDSSFEHGDHGTFTLDDSMPLGWNEALWLMVEGEKRRIWIPEDIAYGGRSDRPQGMLVFEVELLRIRE